MVVESSYGRELLGLEFVRYVIRNAWKSFVFHGGKYAVGFVEQIIEIVLAVDVLTVQSDGIILGYVEELSVMTVPFTLTLPWEILSRSWDLVPKPLFASNLSSLMT